MNKPLYLLPLLGLPLAALVARELGGSVGAGAMLGVLVATALSVGGLAWIQFALRARSKQVMTAFAVAFIAKLFALLIGAVLLRFWDAAAARFDWSAYLLGFASAVVLALLVAPTLLYLLGRSSKESHA